MAGESVCPDPERGCPESEFGLLALRDGFPRLLQVCEQNAPRDSVYGQVVNDNEDSAKSVLFSKTNGLQHRAGNGIEPPDGGADGRAVPRSTRHATWAAQYQPIGRISQRPRSPGGPMSTNHSSSAADHTSRRRSTS